MLTFTWWHTWHEGLPSKIAMPRRGWPHQHWLHHGGSLESWFKRVSVKPLQVSGTYWSSELQLICGVSYDVGTALAAGLLKVIHYSSRTLASFFCHQNTWQSSKLRCCKSRNADDEAPQQKSDKQGCYMLDKQGCLPPLFIGIAALFSAHDNLCIFFSQLFPIASSWNMASAAYVYGVWFYKARSMTESLQCQKKITINVY